MKKKVKILLEEGAILPERKTIGSSGFDLYSTKEVTIAPKEISSVSTGISLSMPPGIEAQIRGRSVLSILGIWLCFSTIDSDYRGKIEFLLINFGKEVFFAPKGTRLGQLVFSSVIIPELEISLKLDSTKRGTKGFGSTGLH